MKKLLVVCFAVALFAFIAAPAHSQEWKGNMKGSGYTDSSTTLKQWSTGNGMGMKSGQSSDAGLKLSGNEQKVDLVKGSGEVQTSSGYKQFNSSDSGYQKSWGTQSIDISGEIKSH
jgi:hypothetical protein